MLLTVQDHRRRKYPSAFPLKLQISAKDSYVQTETPIYHRLTVK